jgi:phosphatidylserine/phosphatidylglycerophosphate/cardiolipin synthase-like enzyme
MVLALLISNVAWSAPGLQEVCFSPEEACDERLSAFIQSAKLSVDVAVFDVNLDQVVHQILVKSKKVPVRILVDRRQSRGPHSLVPLMIKAGAKVRTGHQRGIMHHKFVIVDGRRLMTGSFNFTNGAATKNQENQVYLETPSIVERFKRRFEQSWNEGRQAKPASSSR